MRMKRVLSCAAIIAAMCLTTSTVQAKAGGMKFIEFGVKGGIQTTNLRMVRDNPAGIFSADEKLGYQFGLMSRINFAGLFLQPELLYAANNFTIRGEGDVATRASVRNFQVPIMVGIRIPFVYFIGGPVFNLTNDTDNRTVRSSQSGIHTDFLKSAVAYQLGIGASIWDLNVDVRFHGQFKAPKQIISVGNATAQEVKSKMNGWQLNVGYFF